MTGDTHRIEKNTAKAAEGYVRLRLEQRNKELENENAKLKRELSAAMRELLEERKIKHRYAAELRKLTNMMPDGDVDD